jgi:anti-sigma B factor antagonist
MRCNDLRKKVTQCKNRHYRPYIRGLRAVTGYVAMRKVNRAEDVNRTTGGNVIIRRQHRASSAMTAPRESGGPATQLRLSRRAGQDGSQVVSVSGELDIATAQQAYAYLSDLIDHGQASLSVDLAGLTFCDASGLSVLAKAARRAREAGRQLMLTDARPSLLKIMRVTELDAMFPELRSGASVS